MFFRWISSFFVLILNFTTDGAIFVFGDLAKAPGTEGSLGFFFAFQVLPPAAEEFDIDMRFNDNVEIKKLKL